MNKTGRIKARDKFSPLALRVVQTSKGVFWDKEHTDTGKREFIIVTSPQSAHRLAHWILKNIELPEAKETDDG